MIAHPLVVVPIEALVTPVPSLKLIIGHMTREGHSGNHEMVRAEHLGHAIDNICVQTTNGSADCDHGSHTNDDAYQRQEGSELVGKD